MKFLRYPFKGVEATGKKGNFKGFFILSGEASSLGGSLLRLWFRLGWTTFFFANFSANSCFVLAGLLRGFSVRGCHFGFSFFLA